MEIEVKQVDDITPEHTGGGYSECRLLVSVHKKMTKRSKVEVVIHEVIENYCPMWPHEAVDQLTGLIMLGLDDLNPARPHPR